LLGESGASEASAKAKAVCDIRAKVAATPHHIKAKIKKKLEETATSYLECQGDGATKKGTCRRLGGPHEYIATRLQSTVESEISSVLGEAAVIELRPKTQKAIGSLVGESMSKAGCAPQKSSAGTTPSGLKKASKTKYKSKAFCEGKWGWGHNKKWTQNQKSNAIAVSFAGNSQRSEMYQISPPGCKPQCQAFPVASTSSSKVLKKALHAILNESQ